MKKLVFVCSGNTCRSPMAEMIAKNILRREEILDVEVYSAGLFVAQGDEINNLSVQALKSKSIFVESGFVSKQLNDELIKDSMLVCMTAVHKDKLSHLKNVFTLAELVDGQDISDPFGNNLDFYVKCCNQLCEYIEKLIKILFIS